MELETPKGTRDFLPEEKIIRDRVIAVLKEAFERYGYNPLETPAIENYDTLASKYAGGSEIMKEVYKFEDNGGRKLGLRYDLTVPFARVIATNSGLKKPFKRYQMDKVWRDGPIKLGRYREFWQCDVDVVGIKSVLAEAELFALASDIFNKLNLDVTIFVNNRKLLNSLMKFARIPDERQEDAILSLDKLKKIGVDGVRKELEEKNISDESIARLLAIVGEESEDNAKILEKFDSILENKDGLIELKQLLDYSQRLGVKNIKLDISLARGLAYYTGTVLEIFMNNNSISSSLAAGGRFDKMIGNFIESSDEVPAVGMSFGLDVIVDALKLNNKVASSKSVVKVYIIPLQTVNECIPIMQKIRKSGINCEMDMNGKSINKNLDYADKLGIPFVIIVGTDELKLDKVKLKNMKTGEEKLVNMDFLLGELKK